MGETNQRQHARVETCNLISYACIDAQGTMIKQGMGQALDISQNGLMWSPATRSNRNTSH